jgi:hypothetical protein
MSKSLSSVFLFVNNVTQAWSFTTNTKVKRMDFEGRMNQISRQGSETTKRSSLTDATPTEDKIVRSDKEQRMCMLEEIREERRT